MNLDNQNLEWKLCEAYFSILEISMSSDISIDKLCIEAKISKEEVSDKTLQCLKDSVPSEVPGIAFLSGGQSEIEATEHLNLINKNNNTT